MWIKLRAQCPRCREENFLPCGHEAPRDWSVEIWFFWGPSSSNSVAGMIPSHIIQQLEHKAPKIHDVLYFWRSTSQGSPSSTVWRIFSLSSLICDATRYKIIFLAPVVIAVSQSVRQWVRLCVIWNLWLKVSYWIINARHQGPQKLGAYGHHGAYISGCEQLLSIKKEKWKKTH